jgi:glyoxylase-like metal-dependent hydrolase (beta-lactamase superfamily II)
MNFGTNCNTVCYVWYIADSQPKVLIDAGARAAMYTERELCETDLISVEDGLGKLGLKPGDIDIVIVTHLHWDHIALSHLYKKAEFIVQKKELDYARNPHPIDAFLYDKHMFESLDMRVIDGEKEIIPGLSVFPTPGHSPGGQSVEIDTVAGKAIITGFCSTVSTFVQTEAMKRRGWEVAVPSIHVDVREVYNSALKVKSRADIIIPIHDPTFIKKETVP